MIPCRTIWVHFKWLSLHKNFCPFARFTRINLCKGVWMNPLVKSTKSSPVSFTFLLYIYIYTQLDLKSWMIANQKEKQPKPKSNCRKSSCLSLLHPRETSQCCIIASLLLTQWCWGWLSKRSVHMLWVKQGFLHAMSSDLLLYEMRKNMMVKTSQGTREKERRERERERTGDASQWNVLL